MRYGLIGEKLGHSFSKRIHEELCPYTYDLIPLSPQEVGPFLTSGQFSALNVTIPYKETVLPYLSHIDPAARSIGAVNTIVRRGEELWGYNTDYAGMKALLDSNRISLSGRHVLLLGSGGTSKTAKAVARDLGAASVRFASRHPSGEKLSYEQAVRQKDIQVIINTTPLGMFPNPDAQAVDLSHFPALEAVVDVIYNPLHTRLLQQAESLGIPCCDGLEMLVAQAKYAAELFLGRSIPESEISRVYRKIHTDTENIALIGMPSGGKSCIGQLLAQRMGREFIDLDEKITEEAGMSIPDIFRLHGESVFRKMEKEALRSVCGRQGIVLSPGGGIVKDEENIRLLRYNSRIVFLDRRPDLLVESDPTRPLCKDREAVCRLYKERLPLYRKYSDFTVENNSTEEAAARQIEEGFYEAVGCKRPESQHAGNP